MKRLYNKSASLLSASTEAEMAVYGSLDAIFSSSSFSYATLISHPPFFFQIIGLDSEPVRDDKDEYFLLHRHYKALKSNKMYRESKFVFIPENNLALESAHLDTMVQDIPGVETYWQTDKRPGVNKNGTVTRAYNFLLNVALAENSIKFERNLFTVTKEKTAQCMKDLLYEQALRYHWDYKKAADVHGKDKYTLTGKLGSKQDDLFIAFVMCLYWGKIVMENRSRLDN